MRGRRLHPLGRTGLPRIASLLLLCAAWLLPAADALAQQPVFWLQHDAATGQFGSVTNPTINVRIGQTVPIYLWLKEDGVSSGFDGISFDVRLTSSAGGGTARASVLIDNPAGRWTATTNGVPRTDSGGQGVDDLNAFDLTNSDTIPANQTRFATINVTGVSKGTLSLFLCIGKHGIADTGQDTVVRLGFANGSTSPEALNVSGGVSGLCSQVPEATIVVAPNIGDFDQDGDVDQSDFGRFQACLTGPAVPQNDPTCADAKFDDDADVDENDFLIFSNCISGPNQQADPDCAG